MVKVNMTDDSFAFSERLLQLGAIVHTPKALPPPGGQPRIISINQTIRDLVDALYQVLAGGQVISVAPDGQGNTVITYQPGVSKVFQELKDMEADCTNAINFTNRAAGHGLVIEF